MSVRIRLRRTGKRNAPSHRIVVADQRSPRNGKFIECIGIYNPRHSVEKVDMERADYWLSQGAQPSETVSAIIKRCRANVSLAEQKGTQEGRDYIHAGQQQKPKTRAVEDTEEAPAEGGEETTEEAAAETEETVAEDSAASESDNQDKTA